MDQAYNILHDSISYQIGLEFFSASALIYLVSILVTFKYVERVEPNFQNTLGGIRLLFYASKVAQYFLFALVGFLILEMVINSSYSVALLTIIAMISYLYAILVLCIFSLKLLQWLKRGWSITMILYIVSSIILAINLAASLIYTQTSLADYSMTSVVIDHPGNENRLLPASAVLFYIYFISSIASFLSSWFASIFLLRGYYRKSIHFLFWPFVIVVLLYFISQYTPASVYVLRQFLTRPFELILAYDVLYTASDAIGGILIGISFWIIGKKIGDYKIKKYLYICGCGYVLIFTSNYLINVNGLTFPPFGIYGIPFVALSSFLIFIGIYSSALFIAQDDEIRKFIKRTIIGQGIVGFIGTAESYRQMENRVVNAAKKHSKRIEEESGIEPTIEEDEMKKYIKTVISEIEKSKLSKR